MEDPVSFGSSKYFLMLALLVFGRGMDFLSTWIATPNLTLEGNPIAKKLGWKWGLLLNAVLVIALALWPLSAIVVATASVLVAARNFQTAWLMRSLGEDAYREWHVQRVRETRVTLHLFCLAGNTLLTAIVGAVLIGFSGMHIVPFAIGMGMVAYAIAVAFYSLLAIWRIHRATKREAHRLQAAQNQPPKTRTFMVETYSRPPDEIG
jgi:small-conductance mechanosensitive channel